MFKKHRTPYPPPPHVSEETKLKVQKELRLRFEDKKYNLWQKLIFLVGARLLAFLVKYFYKSSRQRAFEIDPEAQALIDNPESMFIIAMWHNRLFLTVYSLTHQVANKMHDILAIISESKDAEFIARSTEHWGAFSARGSSSKGGAKAIKKILKYIQYHFHPLITPDGPRGPMYDMKEGLPALAKLTKLPIIPMCAQAKRKWVVNSWDQFIIPKPFSKTVLNYGKPIYVNRDEDIEKASERIEKIMLDQVEHVERLIEEVN